MELHENKWGVSGPVMIAVMDGIGLGKRDEGDAVFKAKTPNLDRLASNKFASQTLSTRHRGGDAQRWRYGQQRSRTQLHRRGENL